MSHESAKSRATNLGAFRVQHVPSAAMCAHTRVVPDPEACARSGAVLRESRQRVTARVVLDGLGATLLKVHKAPGFLHSLRGLVKRGRARAEWDAVRYLRGACLPVPAPLAMGEEVRFGFVKRSFYLARFEEHMRDLAVARNEQPPHQAKALDRRVAQLVRAMHDLGFDHQDMHEGNILVGPGPGDGCKLRLIDCHRVRIGDSVSLKRRAYAIARLHRTMVPPTQGQALRDWLSAYEPEERRCQMLARQVNASMAHVRKRRRSSRAKRCFVESTVYTLDVPGGRGARRRDVSAAKIDAAIEQHKGALQRSESALILKQSDRGAVTRVCGVIVKESHVGSGLRALRHRLVPTMQQSGYRNAHRLMEEGVGTGRPLAVVRRRGSTYTLYDDLSELSRLDHLARRLFGSGDRPRGLRLLEQCAHWVGELHQGGIYHGDLKGVNVLVGEQSERFQFHLIDTDRCKFFDSDVDLRRRIKNMAQLAASIPVTVTKTDRLRWFRTYATHWHRPLDRALERNVAQRTQEALDQKIVVLDEPIE